jgi:hypothetical protein
MTPRRRTKFFCFVNFNCEVNRIVRHFLIFAAWKWFHNFCCAKTVKSQIVLQLKNCCVLPYRALYFCFLFEFILPSWHCCFTKCVIYYDKSLSLPRLVVAFTTPLFATTIRFF